MRERERERVRERERESEREGEREREIQYGSILNFDPSGGAKQDTPLKKVKQAR